MLSCAAELHALLEQIYPKLLVHARRTLEQTPGMTEYTEADVRQLVNGYVAILGEAIDEQSHEFFKFFIDTAIPGMVAKGEGLDGIVHGGTLFTAYVIAELSAVMPQEMREEAIPWLAAYAARYTLAVTRSYLTAASGIASQRSVTS